MYVIIIVLLCFVYVCRKQLKPVYISGMPGTGKTATVLAAVNSLKEEVGTVGLSLSSVDGDGIMGVEGREGWVALPGKKAATSIHDS